MNKEKLMKGVALPVKVRYWVAKTGLMVLTGRFDLHRDEDLVELMEAYKKRLSERGKNTRDLEEKIEMVKELKKAWDAVHAPQRKTVTCKVYINNGYYEQIKKYAAAKRYAEAVDDGRLSDIVDDLNARREMLWQKICELEEDLEILKDLMDEDS